MQQLRGALLRLTQPCCLKKIYYVNERAPCYLNKQLCENKFSETLSTHISGYSSYQLRVWGVVTRYLLYFSKTFFRP